MLILRIAVLLGIAGMVFAILETTAIIANRTAAHAVNALVAKCNMMVAVDNAVL